MYCLVFCLGGGKTGGSLLGIEFRFGCRVLVYGGGGASDSLLVTGAGSVGCRLVYGGGGRSASLLGVEGKFDGCRGLLYEEGRVSHNPLLLFMSGDEGRPSDKGGRECSKPLVAGLGKAVGALCRNSELFPSLAAISSLVLLFASSLLSSFSTFTTPYISFSEAL